MSTNISGIEKVDFINSKIDMESHRNSDDGEEEELDFEEEQEQDGKDENLKTRISGHPVYQQLVEAHLECLKIGDISNVDREQKISQIQAMKKQNLGIFSESELDLFMESYCLALGEHKEAMEEPQQESLAFINNMHSELRGLTKTTMHAPAESASSSECKFRIGPTD